MVITISSALTADLKQSQTENVLVLDISTASPIKSDRIFLDLNWGRLETTSPCSVNCQSLQKQTYQRWLAHSYTSRFHCRSYHKQLQDKMFHFCMTQSHLCFICDTCPVDIKGVHRCYSYHISVNHPIDDCNCSVKCKDFYTYTWPILRIALGLRICPIHWLLHICSAATRLCLHLSDTSHRHMTIVVCLDS